MSSIERIHSFSGWMVYVFWIHSLWQSSPILHLAEPWLKQGKPKAKRHKANPRETSKRNFSIKPPPSSSGRKGSKTKTGFNSKSLKFEPGVYMNH